MSSNHFITSEKTWDCIAESFDKTRKKPWKQVTDFISDLSQSSIVCDLGCGNGRHLLPLAQHGTYALGLDISQKLLQITQTSVNTNKLPNVTLLHSNIVNIPLKDNSVDVALYIASLHNIKGRKERVQSLKELQRILTTNGRASDQRVVSMAG